MNKFNEFDMNELDDMLLSCGIIVDTETDNAEIPMDSMAFISMIVEIENRYAVVIPDDMLLYQYWNTREAIAKNIAILSVGHNEKEGIFLQNIPENNRKEGEKCRSY